MRLFTYLFIIAAVTAVAGCGEKRPASVPRRTAFPRIQVPDSQFVATRLGELSLQVNSASRVTHRAGEGGNLWLDVDYPDFGSTVYITATPVDESNFDDVLANRSERIGRNIGGAEVEVISLVSNGFESEIYYNRQGGATPVQFLSVGHGLLLSGVAFVNRGADAPADSLRPVNEMLCRDVIHMLKTIEP